MSVLKEKFYKERLLEYGKDDVRSLGWGSKESQETRFRIATEVGIQSGDSVLDVGCGYGDFYKYLNLKKIKAEYTGIDTNSTFIEIAKKDNTTLRLFCENILSHGQRDIEHDWVVASGIFCFDEEDWEKNVYKKIKHMLLCSRRGTSINFLSGHFLKKNQKGFKHCEPEEVVKIIRKFDTPFCMRHDYLDNDFTVYLFKRDEK